MFYQPEMDKDLRFGDVIKGFVFTAPQVNKPILDLDDEPNYSVGITIPRFSIVLTPCCSIENKTISLSPLVILSIRFFENPYYREDFTRINKLVPPELALPPDRWEKIDEAEKQRRMGAGAKYQLHPLFVYAPSDGVLPEYTLSRDQHQFKTGYYMVDFADIHRVNCDKINRQGEGSPAPPNVKHLQLSVYARKELRDKLLAYYARTAAEDELLLED